MVLLVTIVKIFILISRKDHKSEKRSNTLFNDYKYINHMYPSIRPSIHTHNYTHIYVNYAHTQSNTGSFAPTYTCIHKSNVRTRCYLFRHTRTYKNMCLYTHAYTYIHIYLHTYRSNIPSLNECPGYDTKQYDGEDTSDAGALGNAEHPFIVLFPRCYLVAPDMTLSMD